MDCPLECTFAYWDCEGCSINKRIDKYRCEIQKPSREARERLITNAHNFCSGKITHEEYVRIYQVNRNEI